jgi:transcriptional regulator
MVTNEQLVRIQELIQKRLSNRKIAQLVGVSHQTVGNYRKKRGALRHERGETTYHICPQCRNAVEFPCRACQAKEVAEWGRVYDWEDEEDLELQLEGEHLERYLEGRALTREEWHEKIRGES